MFLCVWRILSIKMSRMWIAFVLISVCFLCMLLLSNWSWDGLFVITYFFSYTRYLEFKLSKSRNIMYIWHLGILLLASTGSILFYNEEFSKLFSRVCKMEEWLVYLCVYTLYLFDLLRGLNSYGIQESFKRQIVRYGNISSFSGEDKMLEAWLIESRKLAILRFLGSVIISICITTIVGHERSPNMLDQLRIFISCLSILEPFGNIESKIPDSKILLNVCRFAVTYALLHYGEASPDDGHIHFILIYCENTRSLANLLVFPHLEKTHTRCKYARVLIQEQSIIVIIIVARCAYHNYTYVYAIILFWLQQYCFSCIVYMIELELFGASRFKFNVAMFVASLIVLYTCNFDEDKHHKDQLTQKILHFFITMFTCQVLRGFCYVFLKALYIIKDEFIFTIASYRRYKIRGCWKSIFLLLSQILQLIICISCFALMYFAMKNAWYIRPFHADDNSVKVNITADLACSNDNIKYSTDIENGIRSDMTCKVLHNTDIYLQCKLTMDVKTYNYVNISWYVGNIRIIEDGDKYIIDNFRYSYFTSVSYLHIRNADINDLGTYECCHTVAEGIHHFDNLSKATSIGKFQVSLKFRTKKYIEVFPSSLVQIYMQYNLCSSSKESCGMTTPVTFIVSENNVYNGISECLPTIALTRVMRWVIRNFTRDQYPDFEFCVSPQILGDMTIVFQIGNNTHHHETVPLILLLREDFVGNNQRLFERCKKDIQNGKRFSESECSYLTSFNYIVGNLNKACFYLEIIYLLSFFPVIFMLIKCVSYLNYCYYCCISRLTADHLYIGQRQRKVSKVCDLFVSFSDECPSGCKFARTSLIPFFQQERKFTVACPDDVVPGELIFARLSEMIVQCRKILIVWSAEFARDEEAMSIHMESLLIPLRKLKVMRKKDVFIIRMEGAHVPLHIRLLGEVTDWENDSLSENRQLQALGERLQQSIEEDSCLVDEIRRHFIDV